MPNPMNAIDSTDSTNSTIPPTSDADASGSPRAAAVTPSRIPFPALPFTPCPLRRLHPGLPPGPPGSPARRAASSLAVRAARGTGGGHRTGGVPGTTTDGSEERARSPDAPRTGGPPPAGRPA
ncbi:hypothetical protein GCM10010405_28330 [Streptomyces macrosporus]|uniref:Uncharacterized protein n=1 Tax=Streptomyces macrosporus TaxID=44032 RepID=A0ABN3JXE3_9ACTN